MRMGRLIRGFAGGTYHIVENLMHWPINVTISVSYLVLKMDIFIMKNVGHDSELVFLMQ